jgi:hypothetical protein
MYLSNTLSLPINSSPAFVFSRQNFTNIDRTTTYEKGRSLCMEQYYRLFSCYRMPGKEQDQLIKMRNNQMEHIIIAYRNQLFV